MRQAIRAVGWATRVLSIALLVFTITIIYSGTQLRIGFAEPKTTVSNGTMTLSIPFNISNGGFYDISNLSLTTQVKAASGVSVSNSSTFIPLISKGKNVTAAHNLSLSLSDMLSKGLKNLLFNDSNLSVDMVLSLEFTRAISLQISSNSSMPWGAPLYNLTLGQPIIDGLNVAIPINFENHSFSSLNGTITLELFNDSNQRVGAGTTPINVPPGSIYSTSVRVLFSGDPRYIREARLRFDTSIFSYGPVVLPIVWK